MNKLVENLRHRAVPWEASMTNDGSPAQVWRGRGPDDALLVAAADRIEALSVALQDMVDLFGGTKEPEYDCIQRAEVLLKLP